MSPWPPRFLFITGRLCLDFAHTGGTGKWAKFERLSEPTDLSDWLRASALHVAIDEVRPAELRAAKELREAIWVGARALVAGRRLPARAARAIEDTARAPDLVPVFTGGVATWGRRSTATQALSTIARDAIALFGTDAKRRVRECRNPRCPLLFIDASRPGRRAWCTMRRCGNIEKTTRYRKKRKAARS